MDNMEKYLSLLEDGVDGLLLTSRYSRYYSARFDIAEGVAIVTKNGCRYFTDSRYIETAEKNLEGYQVQMVDREHPYHDLLNCAIEELGVQILGFEEDYLTVAEFEYYRKSLHAELIPMNKKIHGFRAYKEPWELEIMRRAQKITDQAFADVLGRIRVGMTEKQLQGELIYCLYRNGADNLAFDPIAISGPNTSMPHGVAGDRVIREGDFITFDFGAMLEGYCSDMTRTVAVGHATEEMQKVYDTVLKAQLAGIAATKAGMTGKAVDGAARRVIEEAGYGQYFGHSYGHSVGLEIHEFPNCGPGADTVIGENAVVSAEPGIYIPGKFGVRIEDVVIFRADGCEDITHSPKNLIIV